MYNPFAILAEQLDRIEEHLSRLTHPTNASGSGPQPDEFLSVEETAQFLRVAKQTVYQKKHQGVLKGYTRLGKVYFKRSELAEFMQQGATPIRPRAKS